MKEITIYEDKINKLMQESLNILNIIHTERDDTYADKYVETILKRLLAYVELGIPNGFDLFIINTLNKNKYTVETEKLKKAILESYRKRSTPLKKEQ